VHCVLPPKVAALPSKLLPFRYERSRHQPHRAYRGDGRAARHELTGGWCGVGLRELPALRAAAGPGASGAGKAPSSTGFDFAGRPSGGWYFLI